MNAMRLAVLTNTMDVKAVALLEGFDGAGITCSCHAVGDQKPAPRRPSVVDQAKFARYADSADVLLIMADPLEAQADFFLSFPLPKGSRIVLDISRSSLKTRTMEEFQLKQFILDHRPAIIARNKRQLLDLEGKHFPGETLVCPDYRKFSYLPDRVAADIIWFLLRLAGTGTPPKPPSHYIKEFHAADTGKQTLIKNARRILDIFPGFSPALVFSNRRAILSAGKIPDEIKTALAQDKEGWQSLLSLDNGSADSNKPALKLKAVREHAFAAVPPKKPGKKRILLCVGRKQRDLFIVLLMRYHLEELGYEVFVRPSLNRLRESLVELLPDAVVWGERTTNYKFELGKFAKERNMLSIVRREEAGHTYSSWRVADSSRRRWWTGLNDYSDIVDLEIFSGPESADLTATFGFMPQDKTRSAGAMLFDIYFLDTLADHLPSREEFHLRHGLSSEKPTMMFCACWGHADREIHNAIPEAIKNKGESAAMDPEVSRYIQMCKNGRQKWLDALETLYEKKRGQWNFIFRPHPGERPEAYTTHFQDRGMNIPVLLDDYMTVLLHYVDLLIHAGSTSALEGHFLKIPAITFGGSERKNYLPIFRLSPSCEDHEELVRLINAVRLGQSNADTDVIREIEKEHSGTIDGKACERAAAFIHETIQGSDRRPFRLPGDQVVAYTDESKNDFIQGNARQDEINYFYGAIKESLDKRRTKTADNGEEPVSGLCEAVE